MEHHCHVRGPAVIPPLQIPESTRLINGGGGTQQFIDPPPSPPSPEKSSGSETNDSLMQMYQKQFGGGSGGGGGDMGMSPRSDEAFEVVSSKSKFKKGGNLSIKARPEPGWCSAAIHFDIRPANAVISRYIVQAFPVNAPTKVKKYNSPTTPVICCKLQNNVKYSFRCGVVEGTQKFTKFMNYVIRTTPPGAEKVPPRGKYCEALDG